MRLLMFVSLLGLFLTACSPLREVRFDALENSVAYAFPELESTNVIDKEADFLTQRTQKLESLVLGIDGIEGANIVILENAALVSLDFNERLEKRDIKAKKKVVEHKIKQVDSSVKHVSVSVTDEIVQKIYDVLEKRKP
ncbi:MAG: YhcN/YlaJ family sporulation lipoprotein [Defluviitaleaceae bacterium]|nr:YhcN/YlaJ family sporulation lipoprotein [Defluviitaleaceae bacterium]